MSQLKMRDGLNLNTVLLTVVLGLSAWTLKKVVDLSETQAVLSFRVQALEARFAIISGQPLNTGRLRE
jgi:hypothetical protein